MNYCIISFFFTICLYLPTLVPAQIQLLNDEFDDSRSLVNWKNINIVEQWNIEQLESYSIDNGSPGKLQMIPRTASWFGGWRGPLLYKEVSGNFVFTTKVDVLGRDNTLPIDDCNLAGVMLRHVRQYPNGALDPVTGWISSDNNYLFLSIGAAKNNSGLCSPNPMSCTAPHFEVKSTIDGTSVLAIQDIDTTSTMIRIARIDSVFLVLYRLESDQTWIVHRRYNRSDFPDTIQVGFVTYTDWNKVSSYTPEFHNRTQIEGVLCNTGQPCNPDVIGEFEYARFDSLNIPIGIGTDFLDTNDITDAEVLSFLDFESAPYCPSTTTAVLPIGSDAFQQYIAQNAIILKNTVAMNAIVLVSAMDSIVLDKNFEINNSSSMDVDLNGCNQ